MKRKIAAATVSAALFGGIFAGSIVSSPVTAIAQEASNEADATVRTTVRDVLDGLVADGTLTQAQADAVGEALSEVHSERGHRGRRGGGHGFGSLSEILGLEAGEFRDAIAGGATIADLAEQAGLTTDDVVDALLAEAEERIDTAVADGRLDADEAAEKLAQLEERITDLVNGDVDLGRHRSRGFGPRGGGGDSDATDTSINA